MNCVLCRVQPRTTLINPFYCGSCDVWLALEFLLHCPTPSGDFLCSSKKDWMFPFKSPGDKLHVRVSPISTVSPRVPAVNISSWEAAEAAAPHLCDRSRPGCLWWHIWSSGAGCGESWCKQQTGSRRSLCVAEEAERNSANLTHSNSFFDVYFNRKRYL